MQSKQRYEIGIIGLGVMGRNFFLNMADHGFSVAGYYKDSGKVEVLSKESADRDICAALFPGSPVLREQQNKVRAVFVPRLGD
jgi:6-phosphogluconate dehydrogenase